nr:zinc metalloproteinase nas-14-like [Lepeophtheirus salmonis]
MDVTQILGTILGEQEVNFIYNPMVVWYEDLHYILGVITHELLHILGFAHEQTRPDRDQYVKVNWENIKSGTHSNFWRALGENEPATIPYCGSVGVDQYDNCYAGFRASTFGLNYDYGSIMHYGLRYFSTNGQNTITLKKFTTAQIPNRSGMSSVDIQKTKVAYECRDSTTASTTTPAPTTNTPSPTTRTTRSPPPITTTTLPITTTPSPASSTSEPCVDTFTYCSNYKHICGISQYMNKHCKKTCFNCGDDKAQLLSFCTDLYLKGKVPDYPCDSGVDSMNTNSSGRVMSGSITSPMMNYPSKFVFKSPQEGK